MAAPMSLVCTWQFHRPSPPTTTIESPISPHDFLERLDAIVDQVDEVHHLVAQLADVDAAVHGVTMRDHLELLGGGSIALVGFGQRLAIDDVQRGVEEQQEPGASGVDDAGVLQHREQLGRVVERRLAGCTCGAQHAHQARRLRPPPLVAASADSRTTVRIVPSIGFSTA